MFVESETTVYLYQVIDKVSGFECIQTAAVSIKPVLLRIAGTITIFLILKRMNQMKEFNPAKAIGYNAFTPPNLF